MVTLTRMTGVPFAINPDLIERVDCTPDTVITLVDGTKYLVQEDLDEVQRRVLEYRAQIIHTAHVYERELAAEVRPHHLTAVPDPTKPRKP